MRGFRSNGVYTVKPTDSGQPINVSCEASSPLSGWLVGTKPSIRNNTMQYV